MGHYLAEKCIEYFQKCPKNFERIDQQIEALTEKVLFYNYFMRVVTIKGMLN